ncbi:MAG: hypothetical protein KA765_10850 [Thermoflexales bacterium]|nr:hypothetical protein [Thermoflexales bacterium]
MLANPVLFCVSAGAPRAIVTMTGMVLLFLARKNPSGIDRGDKAVYTGSLEAGDPHDALIRKLFGMIPSLSVGCILR